VYRDSTESVKVEAMPCRGLISAFLAGAAASLGCSALLDLDVQYADRPGSEEAGLQTPDGTPGGTGDGTSDASEHLSETEPDALGAMEVTSIDGVVEATNADGVVEAMNVDGVVEATSLDGAGDAETTPGVPDDSAPVGANITYVQGLAGWSNGAAGPVVVRLPAPVAMNDTIVVAADVMPNGTLQVTDSLHNSYSTAMSIVAPGTPGNQTVAVFYALGVAAGTDSISVSVPAYAFGETLEVYVHEYSGISAFDRANGQTGTTTDMHSGFVTTTAPGDLIFGFGDTGSVSPGTGFAPRLTLNQNLTEDRIAPIVGMIEATATMGMGNSWAMMAAAFKAR
jgi:hypothetical protein